MLRDLHLTALACRLGLGRRARAAAHAWTVAAAHTGAAPAAPPRGVLHAALPDGQPAPAPLLLGGVPARQVDGTTCGAAVLVVLTALGDDAFAQRLTAAPHRFGDLQRAVHRVSTGARWPRFGPDGLHLGHPPWPRRFGTPPWGAAHVARFGDLRFRAVPFDDAEPRQRSTVWQAAAAAVDQGIPVPLYTGGDVGQGWATAVPRHVVLALTRSADDWSVYEPGSGLIHRVPHEQLTGFAAGTDLATRRALGGWRRVSWALLPVPDRRALPAGRGEDGSGHPVPEPKEQP